MTRCTAIIVAGGEGSRLGRSGGKQLALVAGRPVLAHTLLVFEACAAVDDVIVVVHPARVAEYSAVIEEAGVAKVITIVPGGDSRRESVTAGLAAVPEDAGIVIVHDGARPLVTPDLVEACIRMLVEDPDAAGVVVGHPSYDTVKSVDAHGHVERTEDRERLWLIQTPQVFRSAQLLSAYAMAERYGYSGTDDASLVERAGGCIRVLSGPRDNIKVTVPEDLVVVEQMLARRAVEE